MVHDYYKSEFGITLKKDVEIVFGAGTTMMIAALYYALNKKLQRPITVSSNTEIYYTLHEKISFVSKNVEWINNKRPDLSVVVSPSNPLGIITEPSKVQSDYMLYDVVYDKPTFTGTFETCNKELYSDFENNPNIFITTSFSKLGIPGVRCGFLITRDSEIARLCKEYVNIVSARYPSASLTIGRIAFYRYFQNHSWQLENYNILKERREQFVNASTKHGIEILNKTDIVPFIYTNKSVDWWMQHFNVETRKGSDFNDSDDNSRFNLMLSENYWREFIRRFHS